MGSGKSKPCYGWFSSCYGGKAKKGSSSPPDTISTHVEPHASQVTSKKTNSSDTGTSTNLHSDRTRPSQLSSPSDPTPSPVSSPDCSLYRYCVSTGQYASNNPQSESWGSSYYFSPDYREKGIMIESNIGSESWPNSDSLNGSPYHPLFNLGRPRPSQNWPE